MNIGELLQEGRKLLKSKGIESYLLDSELLLGHVLKKDKLFIIINRDLEIESSYCEEYYNLIAERALHKPIKYILGITEFMGLDFEVTPGVLIPRPDTEVLVEKALEKLSKDEELKVCDICCGSGAIGISIASFRQNTKVYMSDISKVCCDVSRRNVEKHSLSHRVKVYESDLMKFASDEKIQFDLVISNPPYIKESEIELLSSDVKDYEPYLALSGGKDGLVFYRRIIKECKNYLKNGGIVAFEIGFDEDEAVINMMKSSSFSEIELIKDLAGLPRVVIGKKNLVV